MTRRSDQSTVDGSLESPCLIHMVGIAGPYISTSLVESSVLLTRIQCALDFVQYNLIMEEAHATTACQPTLAMRVT